MKMILTQLSFIFLISNASAQIMRPDGPRESGSPSRGSNYSDRTSVQAPRTNQNRNSHPRPQNGNRGCNFVDCQKDGDNKVSFLSVDKTPTGILLDTTWKKELNNFAKKNITHSAWGYGHSERNFQNSILLARAEGIQIDEDVLFAASFLHDVGGLLKFEKPGIDHGIRSAEVAQELLESIGFPIEKITAVKEVIIGHVYSKPIPTGELAQIFRDADTLDFLGPLGISRLISASAELSPDSGSFIKSLEIAKKLRDQIPVQLTFESSKKIAKKRILEGNKLLKELERDSFSGVAY